MSQSPLPGTRPADSSSDILCTAHQISTRHKIQIWKVRRFIKSGAVPLYRVGNGRILMRPSEFIAAVEAEAKNGGAK